MDLAEIIGLSLGPGPEIVIATESLALFEEALENPARPEDVRPLFLLSLLPALSADLALPTPLPRATVNYGLNSFTAGQPVRVGDRVRATALVLGAEWLGKPERSALQVIRRAEIRNQNSESVLTAETVTRFIFSD